MDKGTNDKKQSTTKEIIPLYTMKLNCKNLKLIFSNKSEARLRKGEVT
jgi:hypothetical protein